MLVITWNGKISPEKRDSLVSMTDLQENGLFPVNMFDICGHGGYYGEALEDFISKFDEKMEELKEFRKMLDEQYQHQKIIKIDFEDCSFVRILKDN